MEVSSTWDDRLSESIIANFGESKGLPLSKSTCVHSGSYKDMMPGVLLADIEAVWKH
ncbi:hypothetical protein OH492_25635 [Vibrio chagasii]|nr:hypothetical protein [Vibrio chagasii]